MAHPSLVTVGDDVEVSSPVVSSHRRTVYVRVEGHSSRGCAPWTASGSKGAAKGVPRGGRPSLT